MPIYQYSFDIHRNAKWGAMLGGDAVLKWGVEFRLEFIDFRPYWEGGVNRSNIIETFDVPGVTPIRPSGVSPEDGPHPHLSENQKQIIALDYGMRKTLRYYALRRLGLDTPYTAGGPTPAGSANRASA